MQQKLPRSGGARGPLGPVRVSGGGVGAPVSHAVAAEPPLSEGAVGAAQSAAPATPVRPGAALTAAAAGPAEAGDSVIAMGAPAEHSPPQMGGGATAGALGAGALASPRGPAPVEGGVRMPTGGGGGGGGARLPAGMLLGRSQLRNVLNAERVSRGSITSIEGLVRRGSVLVVPALEELLVCARLL